ncbi:MAG: glycosyltransferase family 1 protein [Anaerococcus sp.]|nr:glycosyltransferase family 1 protein [Anaerococcus sp.]
MKIRILHVFGTLNRGGAETLIMNIYRNIDRDQIQFDFLVHHQEEGAYESEAKSLGARVFRIPSYKLINHLSYKKAWDRLLSDHKELKIIHCHKESIIAPVMTYARNHGRIAIAHSHNTQNIPGYKGRIMDILNKNTYQKASYHFACSKDAGRWMYGVNKDFEVINNGIEIDKFTFNKKARERIRARLGITNQKVLGHIARFNEQKNHKFLIDIFKDLVDDDPNHILILAGEGELMEPIKKKVEDLGLSEKVIFLGSISYVNELLSAIDIFILPSLYEGLAVSTIEAQASGVKTLLADTIDKNSKISNLVEFIPIDKGSKPWLDAIKNTGPYKREDMTDIISKAGFNIKETAKDLENFYKKLVRN